MLIFLKKLNSVRIFHVPESLVREGFFHFRNSISVTKEFYKFLFTCNLFGDFCTEISLNLRQWNSPIIVHKQRMRNNGKMQPYTPNSIRSHRSKSGIHMAWCSSDIHCLSFPAQHRSCKGIILEGIKTPVDRIFFVPNNRSITFFCRIMRS